MRTTATTTTIAAATTMTRPRRRRARPAAAARVLAGGLSVGAGLGLVAGFSAAEGPAVAAERTSDAALAAQPASLPSTTLRVVITDPRIDPEAAVVAALRAARTGQARVALPVGAPAAAVSPPPHRQGLAAATVQTTTSGS
jgi:hypothetical protein